MKLRLPLLLKAAILSLFSCFSASYADNLYRLISLDSEEWLADSAWHKDSLTGEASSWLDDSVAFLSASNTEAKTLTLNSVAKLGGLNLAENSNLIVSGSANLSFNADANIEIGDKASLVINRVAFSGAKTISLGESSSLTLGSPNARFSSNSTQSFTITGKTNSSFHIYLNAATDGRNFLNLGDATGLENIHVYGTLGVNNSNSSTNQNKLGTAKVHLSDGSRIFVHNTKGSSNWLDSPGATFSNELATDGTITLRVNGNGRIHFAEDVHATSDQAHLITENYGQAHFLKNVLFSNGKLSSHNEGAPYRVVFRGENSSSSIGQVSLGRSWLMLFNSASLSVSTFVMGDGNTSSEQPSILQVAGGNLILNNALALSNGGSSEVYFTSGTISTQGINFGTQSNLSSNAYSTFVLGQEADTTGRHNMSEDMNTLANRSGDGVLTIGEGGIKNLGSRTVNGNTYTPSLVLGSGTIKASSNWSTAVGSGNTAVNIELKSTSGTVFDPNGHKITINHALVGDEGKLILDGNGTLMLNGEGSSFAETIVKKGTLQIGKTGATSNKITMYQGSGLSSTVPILGADQSMYLVKGTSSDSIATAGNLSLAGGGNLIINHDTLSATTANFNVAGNLSLSGTTNIKIEGITDPAASKGNYLLFSTAGIQGLSEGSFNFIYADDFPLEHYIYLINRDGNNLYITLDDNKYQTWNISGNGNWDTSSANWIKQGISSNTAYVDGQVAIFGDMGGSSHTITLTEAINAEEIRFSNTTDSYTLISGGTGFNLTGSGNIIKDGTGDVTFGLSNSGLSGTIHLNDGRIMIGETNALGTGKIVMSGGSIVLESDYSLNNSEYQITNGTIVYQDTNNFDISNKITGSGSISIDVNETAHTVNWTGKALNQLDHNITKIGSGTLNANINGAFNKNLTVSAGSLLVNLSGSSSINLANVSGNGNIELNNSGTATLGGESSTFSGSLTLKNGTYGIANLATLNNTSQITLDSVTINTTGGKTTNASIQIASAGASISGGATLNGTLLGSGNLSLDSSAYNLTGDLSAYTGNITLANNAAVTFGNGGAAILNGENFIQSTELGGNGTYKVNYSNNITISANLIGAVGLEQQGSGTLILSGSNTTTGALTVSAGTVQIGNGTTDGTWNSASSITGSGLLDIQNTTTDLNLSGLTGALDIKHAGQALVDLSGTTSYMGDVSMTGGGTLKLTSTPFTNTLTINVGTLINGVSATNVYIDGKGLVDLDSVLGTNIKELNTSVANSKITGIDGTISLGSSSTFALGTNNLGATANTKPGVFPGTPIIEFNSTSSNLDLPGMDLVIGEGSLLGDWLLLNGDEYYVVITNGSLSGGISDIDNINFIPEMEFLGHMIVGIEGGKILIDGREFDEPYIVYEGETKTEQSGALFNRYSMIIVEGSLNLNMPDASEAILKELSGYNPQAMINTGNTNTTTVLSNDQMDSGSNYAGSFKGDGNIVKTGPYAIRVGGNANIGGYIDVQEGDMSIQGNIEASSLSVGNNGTTANLAFGGMATIREMTTVGTDSELNVGLSLQTQGINLQNNSAATLNNSLVVLNGSGITSTIESNASMNGAGIVRINSGVGLVVENGASISSEIRFDLSGSNWSLDSAEDMTVSRLEGQTASVSLKNASTLLLDGTGTNLFSGVLSGDVPGNSTIIKTGSGRQTINNTGTSGLNLDIRGGEMILSGNATYNMLTVGSSSAPLSRATTIIPESAKVTLTNNSNVTGLDVYGNGTLILGSSDYTQPIAPVTLTVNGNSMFESGSTLSTIVPNDQGGIHTTGKTVLADTINLVLINNGSGEIPKNPDGSFGELVVMKSDGGYFDASDNAYANEYAFINWNVEIQRSLALFVSDADIRRVGDTIYANPKAVSRNVLLDYADSANNTAGANMLYGAGLQGSGTTLELLQSSIMDDINSGNIGSAKRSMAATTGVSYLGILSAQQADFRHQQMLIRNRITGMGLSQNYQYANELPLYNMWIQGNGAYNKLDSRGDQPGHELTTWGGTVGADLNITSRWTVGAAFTASFGDLKVNGADSLDGDLNNYYVNLFTQYKHKNWTHALILTGGWGEADVDRTVVHSQGLYRANAKSDTSSYGALYEVTYDFAMNKERTTILQPLFSMGIVKSKVDSINEHGAGNAGVDINSFDQTTGTISTGARLLGLVGSNIFGRESVGEVRAQLVQDLGSDHVSADTAYQINPGYTQRIRGAKVGKTGIQLGAGLNIPVGQQGSIFLDANADLRSHANSVSGSVGYRYNF